jgi:uncharacterized damage-inducible protein DinB
MTTPDRAMPPLQADERTTLESWLDFYRSTLAMKCGGLTDDQLRTSSVPPSPLTLQGLVQHMADVERNWFRRVLLGEQVPPIYAPEPDPAGPDGGFDLAADITFDIARATWEEQIAQARANCSGRELEETGPFMGGQVTLRWIYNHMIAEYARHAAMPTSSGSASTARPACDTPAPGLSGEPAARRRPGGRKYWAPPSMDRCSAMNLTSSDTRKATASAIWSAPA